MNEFTWDWLKMTAAAAVVTAIARWLLRLGVRFGRAAFARLCRKVPSADTRRAWGARRVLYFAVWLLPSSADRKRWCRQWLADDLLEDLADPSALSRWRHRLALLWGIAARPDGYASPSVLAHIQPRHLLRQSLNWPTGLSLGIAVVYAIAFTWGPEPPTLFGDPRLGWFLPATAAFWFLNAIAPLLASVVALATATGDDSDAWRPRAYNYIQRTHVLQRLSNQAWYALWLVCAALNGVWAAMGLHSIPWRVALVIICAVFPLDGLGWMMTSMFGVRDISLIRRVRRRRAH